MEPSILFHHHLAPRTSYERKWKHMLKLRKSTRMMLRFVTVTPGAFVSSSIHGVRWTNVKEEGWGWGATGLLMSQYYSELSRSVEMELAECRQALEVSRQTNTAWEESVVSPCYKRSHFPVSRTSCPHLCSTVLLSPPAGKLAPSIRRGMIPPLDVLS